MQQGGLVWAVPQNAQATTAPSTGLFQKATDRSWKTVYVVLRSNALFMYRDKRAAQTANGAELEEPPLPLSDSSVVEVAEDYTKRKNVFRLRTEGGSEYLFQVLQINFKFRLCESTLQNWQLLQRSTSAVAGIKRD